MNPFRWFARSVGERGLGWTVQIAGNFGMDLLFDWRHGTDTMRWEARDELGARFGSLAHSRQYKAAKSRPFLKLLRQLNPPRDCNFVDIGAGKGRVLLIAAGTVEAAIPCSAGGFSVPERDTGTRARAGFAP